MAVGKHSVGIRYCGGCNSRYDRVAAVKALEYSFPQVSFVPADSRQELTLLICGCSSQCVYRGDLTGECLYLYEEKHFDFFSLRTRILKKGSAQDMG
jgi:hypothetical protein